MSQLGLGVMLNLLGGNSKTVNAIKGAIGKTITDVQVDKERDELRFKFTDNSGIELHDNGQSCCEQRYMHTDDDLSWFNGATLLDFALQDGPSDEAEYGDCKDSQFLIVTTSKGQFTVVNYNIHNGYYGGFAIVAAEL